MVPRFESRDEQYERLERITSVYSIPDMHGGIDQSPNPWWRTKHSDFSPRDNEEERLRRYLLPTLTPRRSEDGPHAAYLRQLKAEREERLGRIEHEEPA